MTIAEIQTHYPNPVRQPDTRSRQTTADYCVGMAVLLAHGLWTLEDPFPGEHDLALGLEALNPALEGQPPIEATDGADEEEQTLAYEWASVITGNNDTGDFEAAWAAAGAALTWTRPPA